MPAHNPVYESHSERDTADKLILPYLTREYGFPAPCSLDYQAQHLNASYNRASADSAILSISTAQFRASQANCKGGIAELVDAVQIPIVRGKLQVQVNLTWSGDTGSATSADYCYPFAYR